MNQKAGAINEIMTNANRIIEIVERCEEGQVTVNDLEKAAQLLRRAVYIFTEIDEDEFPGK
jgi:hypothetical protein